MAQGEPVERYVPGLFRRLYWRLGIPGIGMIAIGLIVLALLIFGFVADLSDQSSDASGSGVGSSDPIEQARVVLGGAYSYDTVKTATDTALAATDTPVTNENRSRAWSSILGVTTNLDVDPMEVMRCVPEIAATGAGMTFPDLAGLCATELSLG